MIPARPTTGAPICTWAAAPVGELVAPVAVPEPVVDVVVLVLVVPEAEAVEPVPVAEPVPEVVTVRAVVITVPVVVMEVDTPTTPVGMEVGGSERLER